MADKQEIEYKDEMNILELAGVFEKRVIDTLVPKIEASIKPFQQQKIDDLQKEIDDARILFGEVEKTFLGQREIRRAIKRLNKPKIIKEKDPLEIFKVKPTSKTGIKIWIYRFVFIVGTVAILMGAYNFIKYVWGM